MNVRRAAANPLGTCALAFALALAVFAASRAGLLAWQWSRLTDVTGPWRIFTLGARLDLTLLCYLLAVPALLHLALPASRARSALAEIGRAHV